jgi:hypothetical protein
VAFPSATPPITTADASAIISFGVGDEKEECIGALCCFEDPNLPQCRKLPVARARGRRQLLEAIAEKGNGTSMRKQRRLAVPGGRGGHGGVIFVQFTGRMGNNLIQLAAGYALANALEGYKVVVSEPAKVNNYLAKKVEGRGNYCRGGFTFKITDKDSGGTMPVAHQFGHAMKARPACIQLDGYWQDYGLYKGHREELRQLLAPAWGVCKRVLDDPPKEDELVFHVRDPSLKWLVAKNKTAIGIKPPHHSGYLGPPFEYYRRVITGAVATGTKSLTVITEPSASKETVIAELVKQFGARLLPGRSVSEDLCYLAQAKRLAINGGTFGWIGAFLSRAKEVHYPLSGLLDHERSLNYPGGYWRGPRQPSFKNGLHCDELFTGLTRDGHAISRGKSMLVHDDPGWWYHDIGGNLNHGPWRWFGKFNATLNRFKWYCGGVDPPLEEVCDLAQWNH